MLTQIEKIVLSAFDCKKTISGTALRKKLFNKQRSSKMRELAILAKHQRAFAVERIVGNCATKSGNQVVHYGGVASFDIEINGKRVEVKSALCAGPNKNFSRGKNVKNQRYTWHGIKPGNFDYIVLVAVTPNGLRYTLVDSEHFNDWVYTYGKNGYSWYDNGWFVRYRMKPISGLGADITKLLGKELALTSR
jgi:hypothetical protein